MCASPLFLMEFFLHIYCLSNCFHLKTYLEDCFVSVHETLTLLLFSRLLMAFHFVAKSHFITYLDCFPSIAILNSAALYLLIHTLYVRKSIPMG